MSFLSPRGVLSSPSLPQGSPRALQGYVHSSPLPKASSCLPGVPHSPDLQGPPSLSPPLSVVVWLQVELSDGTAHTITDAYAGKEYIIQVAAKDNEIGTWSDWSVAAHATPWTEEPRHLTTEAQAPGEPPLTSCCLLSSWDLERLP